MSGGEPFADPVRWHAGATPERTALVDAETSERISWRELDRRADRIAAALASRGVRAGDRVAVLALDRAAVVELLVACSRAGAVFAPLNRRLAAPEMAAVVEDAAPALVVVDAEHEQRARALPTRDVPTLPVRDASPDACWADGLGGDPDGFEPVRPRAADPWILCYTGGTTGTPKGALLTHGSVMWNALNTITGWGLAPDDVTVVFTPLFHTGGLNVLLTPLMWIGATSVIARGFDPDGARDLIRRHGATQVFLVPAMFRMMMRRPWWRGERFESVRDLVTGGAPCPRDVFETFADKGVRFRMGYGLTEAGPNTFHVEPGEALAHPGCVGRPLPFVELRILVEGRDAAPDEVGELQIRGPHVFAGYLNRPDATREAFEDGWLRTGDLARRDAAGRYFIAGRRKDMFISGGENVYPTEIEEVILSHPAVADAAVTAVPDERWGEVGLAAVVPVAPDALDADLLRAFLSERIARYKIPRDVVFLDALPLTGAGKVDKRALAGDRDPPP